MPPLLECPEIDCWELLLDETAPADQRERYERHLETCPACQERLDLAEAPEDTLRRRGRRVGDPTVVPVEPALIQVMEHLREAKSSLRTAPGEPADLYFLRPAEQSNLLGTLGAYDVYEVIGQGGMGVVLKAFEPALQRLVAIKVLSAAIAGSANARRRFSREAQSAAAVCHEHIVPVYGVHETDGLPYLVMQYVAGESLQARLDRTGRLELVEILRIGLQTALGLAAAHAHGLIHRDIKPANLLIENGLARVKITDFGLARMTDDVQLTQNGMVAGTPEYMAPEQARGEVVDHRADLFSLGSVLYAMCTGRPPFRGLSAVAVLRQVSDEEPAPLRSLNPEVPAWLEALIGRLLAKAPEDRIQDAAEVAVLLEGYLVHLRQPVLVNAPAMQPPPVSRSAPSRPRVRQLLIWVVFGMLLAALGLTVGLGLLGGNGPPNQVQETGQGKPGRQHVKFDFRKGIDNFPALSLQGPDAGEVARTDSEGLRVSMPEGRQDTLPIEVEMAHRLHGDFDIALGYELIALGKPVPKWGTGVVLRVWFDAPSSPSAVLARMKKPIGHCFVSQTSIVGPDGQDQFLNNLEATATSSKGKLRLVRTGPNLQFLVAEEGQDFKVIQPVKVGIDDVKNLKVECQTLYTPIALDVRLTDLVIDADQFPEGMPGAKVAGMATTQAPAAPVPTRRKGLLTVVVLGVGSLLIFGAVAVWRYQRRGKQTPTKPTGAPGNPKAAPGVVAATCSSCGKSVKARAELAGKRVKCPQCGKAVLVPMTKANETGRISEGPRPVRP